MSVSRMSPLSDVPRNSSAVSLSRVLILSTLLGACSGQNEALPNVSAAPPATAISASTAANEPVSIYDTEEEVAPVSIYDDEKEVAPVSIYDTEEKVAPCPQEMVNVADKYCIDRHEVALFDTEKGRELSPYYTAGRVTASRIYRIWKNNFFRKGTSFSNRTRPPKLPEWQLNEDYSYEARSVAGVIPHGYLSGFSSGKACTNAGKRLCQLEEWKKACKGENKTLHPYGNTYVYGKCNYGRFPHPARLLHGDELAKNLWDPRINIIAARGEQYLHKTGFKSECVSPWNGDAVNDMIGNLDEWVLDGEKPVMVGGGYVRGWTKKGCDARLAGHASTYFDYSLGTRCCMDIQK